MDFYPLCIRREESKPNQIECWFADLTAKRIRRRTFLGVKELIRVIEGYLRENN